MRKCFYIKRNDRVIFVCELVFRYLMILRRLDCIHLHGNVASLIAIKSQWAATTHRAWLKLKFYYKGQAVIRSCFEFILSVRGNNNCLALLSNFIYESLLFYIVFFS